MKSARLQVRSIPKILDDVLVPELGLALFDSGNVSRSVADVRGHRAHGTIAKGLAMLMPKVIISTFEGNTLVNKGSPPRIAIIAVSIVFNLLQTEDRVKERLLPYIRVLLLFLQLELLP